MRHWPIKGALPTPDCSVPLQPLLALPPVALIAPRARLPATAPRRALPRAVGSHPRFPASNAAGWGATDWMQRQRARSAQREPTSSGGQQQQLEEEVCRQPQRPKPSSPQRQVEPEPPRARPSLTEDLDEYLEDKYGY